ncbi:MAG: ferric reductase-like transmembrane domain-containing protein [Anaerolineae bacterium]|nr:ferric reductase-like transmembrane domain-containing protein [Anaerolineae bacterium]
MLRELRVNWFVHLAGAIILTIIFIQDLRFGSLPNTFAPLFIDSGRWALRFLLLSLSITPLYRYLRWRWAIPLRKPLGLWAFGFACVHLAHYLFSQGPEADWVVLLGQDFVILGLAGFSVLLLMALTSNRRAMAMMGQWWKRLHRLVYGAGVLVAIHAMIGVVNGKKELIGDSSGSLEIRFYFVVLVVLLILRIPAVRRLVQGWLRKAPPWKAAVRSQ